MSGPATGTRAAPGRQPGPNGRGGPQRPAMPPRRPRRFRTIEPRRRGTVVLLVFLFVVSLFVGRLVEFQGLRSEELADAALGQRLRTADIPASRGVITDSSGSPLAVSMEVRHITADQTLVEEPTQTAAVLAPILKMDPAVLTQRLTGDKRFVYIKKRAEPAQWRAIQDWRVADGTDGSLVQGIFSERGTVRDYPNGTLAANIVGFVNDEGIGATGLEYGLDQELAGSPGEVTYEEAPGGRMIPGSERERVEPEQGLGVRLTIDSDLQWAAQNAIAAQVKEADADYGMVVALEVGTGRVLAMATAPTFDANEPEEVNPEDWQNRPVTHALEPGSTTKVFTHAAILNERAATPTTAFVIPPALQRGGKSITDHTPHGTITRTLTGVLAESSNIGTILAAETIGEEKLFEYMKKFGVGSPTGLNFPGETSGLISPLEDWSETTFPTVAFGQGMALSALQVTNGFAAVANNGVMVEPRLIDAYVRPDGTVQATQTGEESRVVSARAARETRRMMERVVSPEGTAPKTAIPGYRVGGKTGTAERIDPACGCYRGYTASFVGLAPAEDPKVVVGAWLDNPRNGHYGGVLAGPVFVEVMTSALQSQGVRPSSTPPSSLPTIPKE